MSWSTTSEIGLESFTVLYANDGKEFSELKRVEPRGGEANGNVTTYTFTDPQKRGQGLYKILMTDVNGGMVYSDVKQVKGRCIDDSNVTVFPNPFREIFHIEFTAPTTGDAEILIFDRLGRLIQNSTVKTNQGFNRKELNLKQLPAGTYMMEIRMNDWNDHKMVIKVR